MGLIPKTQNTGELEMPLTDVRRATEIWVALRRDEGDDLKERAVEALSVLDELDRLLSDIDCVDAPIRERLQRLRELREIDTGYVRYHIQGIATTKEIAVSMCRDETYQIGPLPVNVVLAHNRTEWPGLHFPLKDK